MSDRENSQDWYRHLVSTKFNFCDIYNKYYQKSLKLFNKSSVMPNRARFEIIPLMRVVAHSRIKVDVRDDITDDVFSDWVNSLSLGMNALDDFTMFWRMRIYHPIISGKAKPRYEWLLWNAPQKSNALADCVGAFGDILINPACAENYAYAKAIVPDIFKLKEFAEVMLKLTRIMDDFAEEIRRKYEGESTIENRSVWTKRENRDFWIVLLVLLVCFVSFLIFAYLYVQS